MPGSVSDSLQPGETLIRRTKTTNYDRRGGILPWLLGLVLIPALLALLATVTPFGKRDDVESDLALKSQNALAAAGISGADVRMDGVVANVSGVPAGQIDAARGAVESVDGVWSADIAGGPAGDNDSANPNDPNASGVPSASANPVPPAPSVPMTADLKDGSVVLGGSVPDEAARAELIASATQAAGGRPVVDQLTVTPGATLPAPAAELGKAVAILGTAPGNRGLSWDGDTVTLSGSVPTEQDKAAAAKAAAAMAPGVKVDDKLTVAAPAVDKAAVQQQINALIAAQPITFEPNTATLTPAGENTVQQIAPLLKGVSIEVGGHIADAPGNDSVDGQQLSDQRAATVHSRLTQLGVAADRMTAKGYGSTKPVAPNNTAAGQAANRRVEIVVL
ncbi:Outer membrane protein OmpA [Actinokineospora alba]|uniref:Outer membrane protein OmpA n=1 Tax=Actinokineospora alba TaxID=504798 RepID=A0A1H0VAY2_9PSEU|nr:outer membrane protein OmpA-like peptidoglycan-associated protein [Actinokineospora alba]SDH66493.1 Outer membrane protein OmpA [Actinokineospora alba]SDP75719.1 Outer membrane protein OmpA [Actinokineospora alba]